MNDGTTFKHSGDLGDLWYSLPVVRGLGGGRMELSTEGLGEKIDGSRSGFTGETAALAIPLLEAQEYISSTGIWDGREVDFDLDTFRDGRDYTQYNLCEMVADTFGLDFHDVAREPWLKCGRKPVARTVFARSTRYRNEHVDYHRIRGRDRNDSVFVGFPHEHADFQTRFGPISHYPVRDFLEMAEVINGAELFVGNQSCPLAIAIGLGRPYVVEVCRDCRNTIFPRDNGVHMFGRVEVPADCRVDVDRRNRLADAALRTMRLPGEMAEVGVYRGGSATVISEVCPDKTLHLFDTFTGIPENDLHGRHRAGDFSECNIEEVRQALAGRNVEFHQGLFPNTTAGFADRPFSLVHIDADIYQSTLAAIDYFAPRMVAGGIMVFDDFQSPACWGVERAILERFAKQEIRPTAMWQCHIHFPLRHTPRRRQRVMVPMP